MSRGRPGLAGASPSAGAWGPFEAPHSKETVMAQWTRRQALAQMGIAAAAVHTLDPHELCCTVAAHAQTADKDLFELKKLGDGVYAAIAATRYKVNCNAAVIMTDDGVIVVDTHSKPSASRAVYQQIQGITQKPVIKVINTHFHWDHWQGNESDAAKKKNLESNLQQAETFLQELKQMKPALPTRTVATTLTLKEAGREIQLHALGRGHTNGDLYIYLPKEKVVATGDALIDWMPFLNDGYPEEWVQTLTALEKLDFTQIIPGHGDVQAKGHLAFFRGYLSDLIDAVKKASAGGATLAEMQTKIGDQLAPKYEAGMSKHTLGRYRDRVGQNVEMVHKKVVLKA